MNVTIPQAYKKLGAFMLVLIGVTLLLCVLAVLFPPFAKTRLRALGRQIVSADRVVLTDSNNSTPVRAEFVGPEAQKLIHAVSESKKVPTSKNSAPNCPGGMYMIFYKGTNLLAQVPGHDDHFHISETFYHDDSRALETAWEVVYEH